MSSFYKSNLMEGFDSKLIPPENDLKKEEKSIKIDVTNVEENKSAAKEIQRPSVHYPYKPIIIGSQYLIFVALAILWFHFIHSASKKLDGRLDSQRRIIPEKFLDPCNATNVMSFDKVREIQLQKSLISGDISSINTVIGFNISTLVNESLAPKLSNLSSTFKKLEQKLQEQKQIRFECFKENLEKQCEDTMPLRYSYNNVYIYLATCVILLTNSFYYISKAKKLDLTDEQLTACNDDYRLSKMIIILHIVFIIFIPCLFLFLSFGCDVKTDLDKFPSFLFL